MRGRSAPIIGLLAAAALGCQAGAGSGQSDAAVYVPSQPPVSDAQIDGSVGLGPQQVNRAGRPLVSVLLIGGSLRDEYNAAPTFDSPPSRTLVDALSSRLQALDVMSLSDGGADPVDWPVDAAGATLVSMLATDALLVDTALPCTSADGGFQASYLDLEREIFLDGSAHRSCGGRTPSDDVVDTTLTLLVTGGRAPVGQGVAGPTKPARAAFPYLADPN